MVGDETDAFDGLVQFWAVMPMMKRVAESVDALLCRKLRLLLLLLLLLL